MSKLALRPRTRRSGGDATGAAAPPGPTRPGWMQRMDAARSLVAWVESDPGRAGSIADHPGVLVLGGPDGALSYLHRRWVTAFGVALDEELETGALPGPAALGRVSSRLAAEQPGLTRILRHHAAHPAVRAGREHHRRLLAGLPHGTHWQGG